MLVTSLQGDSVSKHPVSSLTVAQAVAEHEQLLGQLKVRACHSASAANHLSGLPTSHSCTCQMH